MILTGSSGLYENTMGDSFPRRGDYDYIKRNNKILVSYFDLSGKSKKKERTQLYFIQSLIVNLPSI